MSDYSYIVRLKARDKEESIRFCVMFGATRKITLRDSPVVWHWDVTGVKGDNKDGARTRRCSRAAAAV